MFRPVLAVVALVLPLAACSGPAPGVSAPSGRVLAARYTYTLGSSCGERALLGTFSITVEDRQVVSVAGLDDPGRAAAAMPSVLDDAPTIEELTARAAAERTTDVGYDETGLLTRVSFDPDRHAIDDEECYTVGGYRPAV